MKERIIEINGNKILYCIFAIVLLTVGVCVAEYMQEKQSRNQELIFPGKILVYSPADHQQIDYVNLIESPKKSGQINYYQVSINSTRIKVLSNRQSGLYKQIQVMERSPFCIPKMIEFDDVECVNFRINSQYTKECQSILKKMDITPNDLVCYQRVK